MKFSAFSLRKIGLLIWVLLAIGLLSLNQIKYWTDSELWVTVATKFYFDGKPEYFFGIKPLFHFGMWINYVISQILDVHPIQSARFVWGLMVLLVMVNCDFFLKAKRVGPMVRFLFQLCLFATSTWLYRAGEVRSDMIVTLLLLTTLNLASHFKSSFSRAVFFILMGLVCFLVTPKAALFFVFLSPLFFEGLGLFSIKPKLRIGLLVLGLVILLLFGLYFSQTIIGSARYFTNQFSAAQGGVPFFSKMRMEHIVRMIWQNPHLWLLGLLFLFHGFKERSWKTPRRRYFVTTFLLTAFILLYPDPLPFFLAAVLPWILLCIFLTLGTWTLSLGERSRKNLVLSASILALAVFFYRGSKVIDHNNFTQKSVMEWANKEFSADNLLVFDPTGIMYSKNAEHWFLGPARPQGNQYTFQFIMENEPDVILFTHKLLYLWPELTEFFEQKYYRWAPSVYIKVHGEKNSKDLEFSIRPTSAPIEDFRNLFRYDAYF